MPRAHPPLPIPATPADVDAAWLEAALRGAGLDVALRSAHVARIAEGKGMLSTLARARVEYARGAGPRSVVLKLPAANEQNRAVAITFNNYERETLFYKLAAQRSTMRTPRVFHADLEGRERFVLVLEDLGDWTQGDQVRGCTPNETLACIDSLAQLHGAFWGRVDGGDFEFVPNNADSLMSRGLAGGAESMHASFVSLFGSLAPPSLRALDHARYLAALPRMQAFMNSAPRTWIQGDFRSDNLFFGSAPEHAPVAVVDWGGSLRGRGIHDLAYLLTGSVPIADRRAHERAWIARWCSELAKHGVPTAELASVFEDYRRAVLFMWCYIVVMGGGLDPNNRRGQEWIDAMIERYFAAFEDLRCADLLGEFE
jgi:aminoglycoside/choline kinase family phosphotransferase